MTDTPSDEQMREEILNSFALEMSEAARGLLLTLEQHADASDDAYIEGLDALTNSIDEAATPDTMSMVSIWRQLHRSRQELVKAERLWNRLNRASEAWAIAHQRSYQNAGPFIAGEVVW